MGLVFLAALAFHDRASAMDELEEMLIRARSGVPVSQRDRDLAKEILEEWYDSERVGKGSGDPAVARALRAISCGESLGPAEIAGVAKLEEMLRRSRAVAPPDAFAAQPVGPGKGVARVRSIWEDSEAFIVVLTAGCGVLATGAAWILAWRLLRRAQGRWR